jgi:ribosomal protein S18 acetylase RimI-like enzyme
MNPLDNTVWHALTGPQAHLGDGVGGARMFRPSIAPFCAITDTPTDADWRDLAALLPVGGATLFRPAIDLPHGWDRGDAWPCYQMVLSSPAPPVPAGPPLAELDRSDVPSMIDLVQRTEPGPFSQDTIDTGRYLGLRVDGRLAAMAGERLQLNGATEISAVCVDPRFRRRGYAARVLLAVAEGITARGDLPFLHVMTANTAAIVLYESLGFTVAREIDAVMVSPG